MIDFDLEIKNIQPINIKNMELKRYKIDDNIIRSIILYNKAIAEIKTKHLDLAIKDLKKALSYNQGFAEGIKLLGLCYVNNKEYKRAEKTFKNLIKYEIYSALAKEYIKRILVERSMSKTLKGIRRVKDSSDNEKKQSILIKCLRGRVIGGLVILTIFMAGIILTLGVPALHKAFSAKAKTTNSLVSSEEKINENFEQKNISPTISYEEYENVQKKLDDTKSELDNYKNKYNIILMLNEVEKSYIDGNYEKAAMNLLHIKNMKFDDESKIKFDKLWSDIKTNYIWTIYNQGNRLYKEGKYQEALPKLKLASEIDPNLDIMPWLTFQIGTCYKETSDNGNALVFFQKVKANYPKSDYASYAESMINQIGNKKIDAIE